MVFLSRLLTYVLTLLHECNSDNLETFTSDYVHNVDCVSSYMKNRLEAFNGQMSECIVL